jgi:hypothetical protein
MLDPILYAIIALFVAWEAAAHYAFHNQQAHTLSNRIAWLERHGGWPVRAGVGLAVVVLGLHLEGAF